jgi:hypothetical protein
MEKLGKYMGVYWLRGRDGLGDSHEGTNSLMILSQLSQTRVVAAIVVQ